MTRRVVAAVALIVVAITQIAPHHHAETSPKLLIKCAGPTRDVPHLHPIATAQRDNCLACFRQHLRATFSKVTLGPPQVLAHVVVVTARIARARTVRLRQSSRAPPSLAS